MSEWHDPSCRRLDLIRFDGTASCMSCGSIAPDIDSALDDLVAQDIYQPIEGKTEFRLLILEPGEFNDPLQCRLYTASTLDAPTYDAMSYTWADETGDATKSSTVRLDAQPFPVTKNCESAMKRVRRQYSPRTIWIDAICVDQMNDRERGHQVQLMPQIYSKAREVFVYIGELESVSEKHFLQDLEVGKIDWSAGGQTSLIPKMLERRYFSRVWVLQEVALAKQATLICGDHTMPWLSFARSMLRRAPEFTIPRLPAVLRFEKRTYRDWGSVLELLDFARETDASDARDKIYAVFGLVACAESEGLVADYTVPVEVANLKMACWITQRYGLLLLIARTHSLSDLDSPGLRWVPDWSRRMARDKLTNLPRASSIGVNSPTKWYTLERWQRLDNSVQRNLVPEPLSVRIDVEARGMRLTACKIGTLESVCRQVIGARHTRTRGWRAIMQELSNATTYWTMKQQKLDDDDLNGWVHKVDNGLPLDETEEAHREQYLSTFLRLQSCSARRHDEVFVIPVDDSNGRGGRGCQLSGLEAELSCAGDFKSFQAKLTTTGQSPRLARHILMLTRVEGRQGEFLLRGMVYMFLADQDELKSTSPPANFESRVWEPSRGVFEDIKIMA